MYNTNKKFFYNDILDTNKTRVDKRDYELTIKEICTIKIVKYVIVIILYYFI